METNTAAKAVIAKMKTPFPGQSYLTMASPYKARVKTDVDFNRCAGLIKTISIPVYHDTITEVSGRVKIVASIDSSASDVVGHTLPTYAHR